MSFWTYARGCLREPLAYDVARYFVRDNFDKLSGNVRNELLIKVAWHDDLAAMVLANVALKNFDKLPGNVRNELLIKLADNEYVIRYINNEYVKRLAYFVRHNFDNLPVNVRDKLPKRLRKYIL